MLSVMILPYMISSCCDTMVQLYDRYCSASGALGTSRWYMASQLVLSASTRGILISMALATGRAMGETMAVMMVAGNVPNMPDSIFQSVRFLTTAVSSEMAYSSGLQRQALFSIALVLFLFIMLINATLNFFLKREKE